MGIRKRGEKWQVTAEFGVDEFGVRRRVCRTISTEDEAKRLEVKLLGGEELFVHDLHAGFVRQTAATSE